MTDKIVVFITAANRREAKKIAKTLVEQKLAACVNITQPVESIYRWQGKVCDEREFLLVVKSRRELFPKIRNAVLKLHSYKVPEVICLPIVDGSEDYLQWVADSVKLPDRADSS